MDVQAPASAQAADKRAPFGPSLDALRPAASLPSVPRRSSGFACAPRGPRRAGRDGAGARAAAERFGLDWATAAPAALAVAAEACARVPEEWEIEGPGIAISLGDAADLDPDLLEAMLGPDGLGGQSLGPQFGQGAAADALRPGPILAALTEQAVADAAFLTDDQLTGALQAARRQEARDQWQQTILVAEYARRRAARAADAKAAGVPKGRRPGEFPDDELAAELLITRNQAAGRIEADLELTSRLPADAGRDGRRDHHRRPRRHDRRRDPVPFRRRRRPRRRDPRRRRAGPAGRPARPQGRRPGDEARSRGRQDPQTAREEHPAAGRGAPGAVRQRLLGGPRARHRHRPGLQGAHRRSRGQAPQPRPSRRGPGVGQGPRHDRAPAGPRPLRPPPPGPIP